MQWSRLLHNQTVRLLLAVLLFLLAFQVWSYAQAPAKLAPGLVPGPNGKLNIVVELNFPPERYHIQLLQDYGRVTGTDGNEVQIRNITPDAVQSLARTYWVKKIHPLPAP